MIVSGLPLPVTARTMSDANRIVTLTLGGLLAPDTAHTLFVDGVRDRAGNLMPAQAVSTFTTSAGVDPSTRSSHCRMAAPRTSRSAPPRQ